MGLIVERVKRLIAANLRELIEEAKDPQVELLEYVADIERSYGEIKAEMVDAANGAAHFEKQFMEIQTQAEKWGKKAMAAVQQKEDDLAREALTRKAHSEALVSHIAVELQEQWELADSLRKTLEQLQQKLHEAEKQKNILLGRSCRANAAKRVSDVLKAKHLWNIDTATERLSEEIMQQRHRMEAYQELHKATLEAEFERLAPKKDIENELKMLKTQLLKGKKL